MKCKYCNSEKTAIITYAGFMRDYEEVEIVHEENCITNRGTKDILFEVLERLERIESAEEKD